MENEIELYEWMESTKNYPKVDLYAPGGMARERYYDYEDGDDEYDYDADWRTEDAYLESLYEDRYDYEGMNSSWD